MLDSLHVAIVPCLICLVISLASMYLAARGEECMNVSDFYHGISTETNAW